MTPPYPSVLVVPLPINVLTQLVIVNTMPFLTLDIAKGTLAIRANETNVISESVLFTREESNLQSSLELRGR